MATKDPKTVLDNLMAIGTKKFPALRIAYKDASWLMWFVNLFIGLFNKDFMTKYITTIGPVVYLPSKAWQEQTDQINFCIDIAHEYVHVCDRYRMGIWFSLSYLFPQILALPALLCFFGFIWPPAWFCLIFLVFLAPWPSPGRTYIESRGYAANILTATLLGPYSVSMQEIASSISGNGYYWGCWSSSSAATQVANWVTRASNPNGSIPEETPYVDIKDAFNG